MKRKISIRESMDNMAKILIETSLLRRSFRFDTIAKVMEEVYEKNLSIKEAIKLAQQYEEDND